MTEQEFWEKIIISVEEKDKALHFLRYRGIQEHENIKILLESLTGEKVSYSAIATAMRYDKRIRRILYKFIGFLEEYIRAYISNKYSDEIDDFSHSKQLNGYLENDNILFNALSSLTFGQLIIQVKKLREEDKLNLFPYYYNNSLWLNNDLTALVKLRNEVSHNRFLVGSKRLAFCHIGDKNSSLWGNIINLMNCLPEYLKQSFINEINNSQYNGNDKYDNQTDWNLEKNLIVEI